MFIYRMRSYLLSCLSLLCTLTPDWERQTSCESKPLRSHLSSSNPFRLCIPRIHTIHTRIHCLQLWTAQPRQIARDSLRQRLQRRRHILIQSRHYRWRFRLNKLEDEAFEIVALGQSGAIEDAVCQGGSIETREGVWGAGVAADGEEARVKLAEGENVEDEAVGLD